MLKSGCTLKIFTAASCVLALWFAQGFGGNRTTGRLEKALRSAGPGDQIAVWVFFTDKGRTGAAGAGIPLDLISARALQRRARVLPADRLVDETDIPVSAQYIAEVTPLVSRVRQISKWLNGVSLEATPAQISLLDALPFVREIEILQKYRRVRGTETTSTAHPLRPLQKPDDTGALDYGPSLAQVSLENIPAVHATGNSAQGIIIGVFDNGFRLLSHEAFDLLRPRIIAQHDFVDHKTSVIPNDPDPSFGGHGVYTLSTLAGYKPGRIIGPAYGASFILARTENDSNETPISEDSWAAAIEWAESLGVQVTSTSLGYLDFDPGYTDLTWQDMNGRTSVISRAAVMAARKGVIVVNSAGNDGQSRAGSPNTLIAPADADSILSAGAVTPFGVRADFSSYGPTSDGRVKPDVMATGTDIQAADPTDTTGYTYGGIQGTSFSCPLTAGVAALVLRAHPEATAMQIISAIKTTAYPGYDQSARPDNFYGWGIVDAMAAIQYLSGGSQPPPPRAIAATDSSATGFTANWEMVSGATGYALDVATDFGFASIAAGYNNHIVDLGVTNLPVTGLTPDMLYYYRVRAISTGGTSSNSNVVRVSTTSGVAQAFTLSNNYPNPFNPGTRIDFQISQRSHVTLRVYDMLGRPVKTLIDGFLPPSVLTPYSAIWDGTDETGTRAASGIYYYRMDATGESGASSRQVRKMVLVR